MKFSFTRIAFAILFMCFHSISGREEEIATKFQEASIVPDIIEEGPVAQLQVEYGIDKLLPGQILSSFETEESPNALNWPTEEGKTYALLLLDPDATSRAKPIFRSYLHWLVVNIPGSEISKGNVIAAYKGPTPPKGTGLHRYVFLVYAQTQRIDMPEFSTGTSRGKFSMQNFIHQHMLTQTPIAGNYFQTQSAN